MTLEFVNLTADELATHVAMLWTNEHTPRSDVATIAVAGAAALGKTTFCEVLVNNLRARDVTAEHVRLDGFLIPRQHRPRPDMSGYDPKATDHDKLLFALTNLLARNPTTVPLYDRRSGTQYGSDVIAAATVIVLDGSMSLHEAVVARCHPFIVFFDGADDLLLHRLAERYVAESRCEPASALLHALNVQRQYNYLMRPRLRQADLLVHVAQRDRLRYDLQVVGKRCDTRDS